MRGMRLCFIARSLRLPTLAGFIFQPSLVSLFNPPSLCFLYPTRFDCQPMVWALSQKCHQQSIFCIAFIIVLPHKINQLHAFCRILEALRVEWQNLTPCVKQRDQSEEMEI